MKGWLLDMDEAEEQTTGDLELAIEGGLSTALFPSLASQMHPGAVPEEEGRNDWPGGGKYDRHSNSRTFEVLPTAQAHPTGKQLGATLCEAARGARVDGRLELTVT